MAMTAATDHNKARITPCEPQHAGGVHLNLREAEAVRELFRRYVTGTATLSQSAQWLNDQGFRTRNRHWVQDGAGNWSQEPRHFTTASVRGILHNPFYAGMIKHGDELLPGVHQPLVSWELFQQVQAVMKRRGPGPLHSRRQVLHDYDGGHGGNVQRHAWNPRQERSHGTCP